jgi:hypothetical protein
MKTLLPLFFGCVVGVHAAAPPALQLTSPLDYQVFQRQTERDGRILIDAVLDTPVRGALTNLDKLEARLTGKSAAGNELPGQWQPLPFDNRVRQFRAEVPAPAGGWYRLEVRLMDGGALIAGATVERVGVGEVFVVAGQSNSANHGEERQQARNPLVVAFGDGHWQPAHDPQPGATGTNGSFLPVFGDAMAERFKVPIGLVAIGVGSTSVREWLPKGEPMAAPPSTGRNTVLAGSNVWLSTGALFARINDAQRSLGTNGFRALLWHQGESDAHQSPDRQITAAQYRQYLQHVIDASRRAAGWRVPWFVAQVSYHSPEDRGSEEFRAAQKSLVTDDIALGGPDTDDLGPEFREKGGKGIHFNARGLQRHGELWTECVAPWLKRELNGAAGDQRRSTP